MCVQVHAYLGDSYFVTVCTYDSTITRRSQNISPFRDRLLWIERSSWFCPLNLVNLTCNNCHSMHSFLKQKYIGRKKTLRHHDWCFVLVTSWKVDCPPSHVPSKWSPKPKSQPPYPHKPFFPKFSEAPHEQAQKKRAKLVVTRGRPSSHISCPHSTDCSTPPPSHRSHSEAFPQSWS